MEEGELLFTGNFPQVQAGIKRFSKNYRMKMADGMDHATRSFYKEFYKTRLRGRPGVNSTHGGLFHRFRRVFVINDMRVTVRVGGTQYQTTTKIADAAEDPLKMKVEMWTTSRVAGMLERGGTIKSEKGMPIPVNRKAKEMLAVKGSFQSIVDANNLVLFKQKNGKAFFGKKREGMKPERLFKLVHSIDVKPRLGFYGTWVAHKDRRYEIMLKAMDEALRS
jgi:hypothetical protein